MGLNRLKLILGGLVLLLGLAWLLSLPAGALAALFWPLRRLLLEFTGILAIGLLSVTVMLAARPLQLEAWLGGLDKYYRLHRWLGLAGVAAGALHWLLRVVPPALVELQLLIGPHQGGRSRPLEGTPPDWHRLAAEAGPWAFTLLLLLVGLALWRRFPYRYFFRVHRLMAAVYLLLVFHSVLLLSPSFWAKPVGWLLAPLLLGGSLAAALSLFHRIGHGRKAVGRILALEYHHDGQVLDLSVELSTAWPGHRAGQFAFVAFADGPGPHPFVLTSGWQDDGLLHFSIKGLGDYSRRLPRTLATGQEVNLEGPYGRFTFAGRRRQLWVAAGIGVTPFIARLEELARVGQEEDTDFIYATATPADSFIGHVRSLAERAGVRLHLVITEVEEPLTMARLATLVPDWAERELWFCGPREFGDPLRQELQGRGFAGARFHQELFDMR
ncbi:ferredoxin reductase family protein [Zobellella iuensis]|uniref:Ferric reductase-like transmembrane domain-containing protein n=1 Tax=Zobellella iuensis TaxID=2803811 RepID=A0ABS1QMU6_9GAMM|nr:ferric reductase-like transmembrane domain-containing protein [Zobellella iuensis]MBL1376174.1 ferric reductase-like transmembrane domain-containing protein [Zobellella iuensis]